MSFTEKKTRQRRAFTETDASPAPFGEAPSAPSMESLVSETIKQSFILAASQNTIPKGYNADFLISGSRENHKSRKSEKKRKAIKKYVESVYAAETAAALSGKAGRMACINNDNSLKSPAVVKQGGAKAHKKRKPGKVEYVYEPKSIKACETKAWHLNLVRKSTGEIWDRRYVCESWRHAGDCQRKRNQVDYARMMEGLKRHSAWLFCVLTVYRTETPRKHYKNVWRRWQSLRQWLVRNYGEAYFDEKKMRIARRGRIEFVAVTEKHKDGFPHVNVVFHLPGLLRAYDNGYEVLRHELNEAAVRCGWGIRIWLDKVRSKTEIAGYFSKILGELTKGYQIPLNAPPKFRRVRASQGLLPPKRKDVDLTGCLVQLPLPKAERMKHDTKAYTLAG